jgi:RimJ/RimL family protein N-acetyltransferase
MNDHDEIETERLVLRPLAPGHVGALHDIYSDSAAMRFWHEPPHRHAEQTRAMVERFIAGSEHAWVLCRKPQEDAVASSTTSATPTAMPAWATSSRPAAGAKAS